MAAVPASLDVPPTQTTAPVLEYRCLFTPDLRKKQKKWQDGRLKLHTFNSKVVVYDDRANIVGDTHWREGSQLEDGDEIELERGGFLVQVGEYLEKRDQDLSELVDKRKKEKGERAAAKLAASPAVGRSQALSTPAPHLKPKALNTLLTPSGHYGRASVSNASPFEERQRLDGLGGGNENERPSKRRKQVESTQSKNGYAQNLMGASLSLSSSRPPGTASIQYEPFKTKPAMSRPPPQTIDLTFDDDEDDEIQKPIQPSRRARPLKTKRHRSPPPRSTYAGNLTGVALTLSRPEPVSPKRINTMGIKSNLRAHEGVTEFFTEDDDSALDIRSSPHQIPAAKTREPTKKPKLTKSKPISHSPSSSPPPIARAKTAKHTREEPVDVSRSSSPVTRPTSKKTKPVPSSKRKETINRSRSSSPMMEVPRRQNLTASLSRVANRDVIPGSAEQPVSALRIKARPPRKMMMLMDRPSSRSSLNRDSTSKAIPKQRRPEESDEPVLSQATEHLNAFCQRQEERLQARVNGNRPRINLDLDDFDSSPLDSGISHQAIDNMLTRKPVAAQPSAPTSNEPEIIPVVSSKVRNMGSTKAVGNAIQAETIDKPITERRESVKVNRIASNQRASEGQDTGGQEEIPIPSIPMAEANTKLETLKTIAISNPANFIDESKIATPLTPIVQTPAPWVSLSNVVAGKAPSPRAVREKERLIPETSPEIVAETRLPQQAAVENEQSLPKITPKKQSRAPKPPKGINGDIESATEYFRAIVKSSSASEMQVDDIPDASSHTEETVTDRNEKAMDEVSDFEKSNSVSIEPELEKSPKPRPIEQASPKESGEMGGLGFHSAQNIHVASEEAGKTLTSTDNAGMGPQKAKLLNPATRGKSLQKTVAEANDAMAQALRAMPPPLIRPRILSRPAGQPILARDEALIEGQIESGPDSVPLSGPWSREAFDLFGSWRPPAREAIVGNVAG
ncbi:Uncharacterized protein LSUE1_G006907 [Lachnellula suecica]|uniref:5'-3' DNA helicase ZGRF1-like N-terminal domain-containing protein n=1 Tax=Lachnellula suecica TaxID=602035 RepID=A0A8T9CE61_9HELO|nr:Uncharacterized protein LSUE1_G006907 [Lachnellula suecica]